MFYAALFIQYGDACHKLVQEWFILKYRLGAQQ